MGSTVRSLDYRQAADAASFAPASRLTGPIEQLSFLRASLLFAEISRISYLGRADAGRWACQIGLPEIRFYNRDGAQAYILGNDRDAVVVCRGTEPNEWNDVRADLDAATAVAETAGRVHRGFKREVDDLWPRIEQALISNTRTLWFAGHSLGGAMATICAGRCKLSHINSNPRALFTYGAPRVGNRRYVNFVKFEFYRWVNNNDIVPRVPPTWLGYRHTGTELYLNSSGKICRARGLLRLVDRLRGLARGLVDWRLDPLSDHSLDEYIKHVVTAVQEQETGRLRPTMPNASFEPPPVNQRRAAA